MKQIKNIIIFLVSMISGCEATMAQAPVNPIAQNTNKTYLEPSTGLIWGSVGNGLTLKWYQWIDSVTLFTKTHTWYGAQNYNAQININNSALAVLNGTGPSIYLTNSGLKVGTTNNLTHNYTGYNNGYLSLDNGSLFVQTLQYRNGTVANLDQIPSSLPPSGAAGGDLTGNYPNPTVNIINGITKTYYDPTSSIQTQLNARELLANKTATASTSTTTYPNWLGVENYAVPLTRLISTSAATGSLGGGNLGGNLNISNDTTLLSTRLYVQNYTYSKSATNAKYASAITLNTASVLYNTPITFTNNGSGSFSATETLISQAANTFLGNHTGSSATPTFATMTAADLNGKAVLNQTSQQTSANYNITGQGTIGNGSANSMFNPSQYVAASRMLLTHDFSSGFGAYDKPLLSILSVAPVGNNTVEQGIEGVVLNFSDQSGLTAGQGNNLLGFNITMNPLVARTVSGNDDVTWYIGNNISSNNTPGSDFLYWGNTSSPGHPWGSILALSGGVLKADGNANQLVAGSGYYNVALDLYNSGASAHINNTAIYLPNSVNIMKVRNAGNTADLQMLSSDASNSLFYGDITEFSNGNNAVNSTYSSEKWYVDGGGTSPKVAISTSNSNFAGIKTYRYSGSGSNYIANYLVGGRGTNGDTFSIMYNGGTNTPIGSETMVDALSIDARGRVGLNNPNPTSFFHLQAGQSSSSRSPMKFTIGVDQSTPEVGSVYYSPISTVNRLGMVLSGTTINRFMFADDGTPAIGDLPYAGSASAYARLAGNTTTTQMFLTQTGSGSASAAPVWTDLFGSSHIWLSQQTLTSPIVTAVFNNTSQSTISGSTSGSIKANMPEQGINYKVVWIKVLSLNGTATFVYPTAFTDGVGIVNNSVSGVTLDTSSNSQVIVTGTGVGSGLIELKGY